MLTSPGDDKQREFITKAFENAQTLVNLAQPMAVEHQSTDADQVFQWLFGTENGAQMRGSLRGTFLAQWRLTFLPRWWPFSPLSFAH